MNIVEYVKQCGDKPLTAANLREADTLVLTALSYPTLLKYYSGFDKDITLGDAASQLLAVTLQFREKKFRDFLIALSGSKRFNQLKICGYRDEFEVKECAMQFSAVTVKISDQLWFISYSGTDSTVAGWKEDFQFAYMEQTPAQLKALHYLEEAAGSFSGNFIISGHSKGGNLAAYAALFADERIQERYLKAENKNIVDLDRKAVEAMGARIISGDIFSIDEEEKIRHNALKTAYLVFSYLMEGE